VYRFLIASKFGSRFKGALAINHYGYESNV
jgi:hypothetical protein